MRLFVLVLFVLVHFCAFADVPTLDDLGSGVRVHIRSYDGLEFSVTSSLYQENSDGEEEFSLPEVRETIRLHIPEKGPAWKYWVQKIQDEFDDQWIVSRFRATNVKETRYFTYFPESEGQWSRGSIIPLYQWHENEGRHFFTFLGLDTTGLSLLELGNLIADEDRNEYVERYNLRFVKEERFGDKNVWVFHGKLEMEFQGKNIQTDYKLCVLHPQNMIVHWEGSMGEDSLSYIVEDIGIFEGICYPRRGRFHQSQTMGLVGKIDYKFEVTDVRRYSSELLSNWFPEWPPGTSAQNIGTGKITRIPPSERQLAKVAKIQKDMLDSYAITPRSTTWLVVRITLVIIGSALILYALYRMSEKRKKDPA